jgi:hypothetical protein
VLRLDGNARLVTPDELGDTIPIRQSDDNEEVETTHKDCNAAHRTLGVIMMKPAVTQKAEAERLLERGKKIATKETTFQASMLKWYIGVTMYLGYSLPLTIFLEYELNHYTEQADPSHPPSYGLQPKDATSRGIRTSRVWRHRIETLFH